MLADFCKTFWDSKSENQQKQPFCELGKEEKHIKPITELAEPIVFSKVMWLQNVMTSIMTDHNFLTYDMPSALPHWMPNC